MLENDNNNNNNNIIPTDIDNKKENLIDNEKASKEKDNNINVNNTNKNNLDNKNTSTSTFMNNFNKIFLNKGKKNNKKTKSDEYNNNINLLGDELINKNLDNKDDNSDSNSIVSDEIEEPEIIKANPVDKFRSTIKRVIYKWNTNEWNKLLKLYEERIKEKNSFKYKMKNIFNIKSDLMVIWKLTFSAFNIIFVFIFFLKYIVMDLSKREYKDEETSKKILFLYSMINLMFLFELILSILVIIFNGGSFLTFLKLPLKIYNAIPFQLKKSNIFLLIPKFFRIDLFEKLFSLIESFINSNVAHYVQNYYLKIFITYTNDMFKYLLVFFFYAHCLSSLLCFFYDESGGEKIGYVSALYYTIETFTTIGFGDLSPNNSESLLVMILTLFLGVNFMAVITSNIRYLSNKMRNFNRETSFNEQFEFLVFQIQKSTGKVFPSHLKKLMSLFLLFRRGLAYSEIKSKNKQIFDVCKDKIVKKIHKKLFDYLKEDFSIYFKTCEDDFIFEIFECMKPKMFKANKTIIDYNQKVKGLYFLINGNIFIYDKNNNPVYAIIDNNLFGEYEFISNTKSNYIVKVHPKMAAYGFILKKSDWEKISKKYIISSKKFIETIKLRNKKHNEWILYSLNNNKNKIKNEEIINNNINNINNIDESPNYYGNLKNAINDSSSLKIEDNKNNINKNNINKNIIAAKKKNEKKSNEQVIFLKIDEMYKDLQIFENKLIELKKDMLNEVKIKNF